MSYTDNTDNTDNTYNTDVIEDTEKEVIGETKQKITQEIMQKKIKDFNSSLEDLYIEDIIKGTFDITNEIDDDAYSLLVSNLELKIKELIISLRLLNKKYFEKHPEKTQYIKSAKANIKNIFGIERIPLAESTFDFLYKRGITGVNDSIYDITLNHKFDTWKEKDTPRSLKETQDKYITNKGGYKKKTRKSRNVKRKTRKH